jgi:hypothetical protein
VVLSVKQRVFVFGARTFAFAELMLVLAARTKNDSRNKILARALFKINVNMEETKAAQPLFVK